MLLQLRATGQGLTLPFNEASPQRRGPLGVLWPRWGVEYRVMTRILLRCQTVILGICSNSAVSCDFLAALTANESLPFFPADCRLGEKLFFLFTFVRDYLPLRRLQPSSTATWMSFISLSYLASCLSSRPLGPPNPSPLRGFPTARAKQLLHKKAEVKNRLSEALAERASRMFAERVGMPGASPEAIRERLALAETVETENTVSARALRLLETVKDGVVNQVRAMELARDNEITLADYIAVQEAERRLDEAVREGKILPRDRQFFFREALERPSEFADFVKRAVSVVRLGSQGIGSVGDISVDEEVEIRTRNLMKDEGLSYAKALKRVLAGDKELERRYHGVHRREIGATAGGVDGTGITQ
jgi:hypothetical protein